MQAGETSGRVAKERCRVTCATGEPLAFRSNLQAAAPGVVEEATLPQASSKRRQRRWLRDVTFL
jgi:hypothetical protein